MIETETFEPMITHVAIDEEGNETEVKVDTTGVIQDKEYSDTPEGN